MASMNPPASAPTVRLDDVELDRNGMEVLGRDECLRALAAQPLGRVGLCMRALPVVLPVNFTVATPSWALEPLVVMRCSAGAKVAAAMEGSVIALEVDGYDPLRHSGWSVLVQGLSRVIDDPAELEWAASLPLRPWAVPSADRYVALDTDIVRGRRFGDF
jgi:nitroimidazol reductase NimA-like FMN-containing flavoprotein (pyridoxamine 5'-phosphate oxidase superfamily)